MINSWNIGWNIEPDSQNTKKDPTKVDRTDTNNGATVRWNISAGAPFFLPNINCHILWYKSYFHHSVVRVLFSSLLVTNSGRKGRSGSAVRGWESSSVQWLCSSSSGAYCCDQKVKGSIPSLPHPFTDLNLGNIWKVIYDSSQIQYINPLSSILFDCVCIIDGVLPDVTSILKALGTGGELNNKIDVQIYQSASVNWLFHKPAINQWAASKRSVLSFQYPSVSPSSSSWTRARMKVWVFLFCASPVGGSSALCVNLTSASITQNTRTHDPPTVQQLPHLIIPSSSSIPLSKSVPPNCNMRPISGAGGSGASQLIWLSVTRTRFAYCAHQFIP